MKEESLFSWLVWTFGLVIVGTAGSVAFMTALVWLEGVR